MSLLTIDNLHARVEEQAILNGLSLTVRPGEVHAVMGPNGSGKSTLANVLAGRPGYEVTQGAAHLGEIDLLALEPHERAHAGLFLAFQYPVEIPGVSNMEFLKASADSAARAAGEEQPNAAAFVKRCRELAQSLPERGAVPQVAGREHEPVRRIPGQVLEDLVDDRLLALEAERIQRVEQRHAAIARRSLGEPHGVGGNQGRGLLHSSGSEDFLERRTFPGQGPLQAPCGHL